MEDTSEIREQKRKAAIAEHARVAKPVIEELKGAGFNVQTLDELRRSGREYRAAVPILLHWLPRVSSTDEQELFNVKESIVRCLSVPWAKGHARAILQEFYKAPKEARGFRWAVGNAMEVIADESTCDEIMEIVADASNGTARQMFALTLGKLKHKKAIPLLVDLLEDEGVAGHVVEALGQLRATEAKGPLETMLTHRKAWIRKAAATALNRINRAVRQSGPAAG